MTLKKNTQNETKPETFRSATTCATITYASTSPYDYLRPVRPGWDGAGTSADRPSPGEVRGCLPSRGVPQITSPALLTGRAPPPAPPPPHHRKHGLTKTATSGGGGAPCRRPGAGSADRLRPAPPAPGRPTGPAT